MKELMKNAAVFMKSHSVQLLTILVMMAVIAPPAGASHGSGVSLDTLLNDVYEDVKGNVETQDQLLAGKKRKGGYSTGRRIKKKLLENHGQVIAGTKPMGQVAGRIKRPMRIKPKLMETPDRVIAGKKKKGGIRTRLPEIKGSYKETHEMPMAGSPGRSLSDVRAV